MENLDFNRSHGSCRVAAAWHPAIDGNPWVAAMGEQLVRGSGAGAGMWQWHGSGRGCTIGECRAVDITESRYP